MEQLIETYGYPVIFGGTFFEGETVVLIAGYLANRGYLALEWVILAAFLGSWFGDTMYFFIGRRWGHKLLERWPTWRQPADRALDMLHRYHAVFILSFRFLYGLRTVSPFVIGMSKVPASRFVFLNMVASAIWATAFTSGGYLLGTMLETVIGRMEHIEAYVLGGLVAAALVGWLIHMQVMRRRQRTAVAVRARKPSRPGDRKGQNDVR